VALGLRAFLGWSRESDGSNGDDRLDVARPTPTLGPAPGEGIRDAEQAFCGGSAVFVADRRLASSVTHGAVKQSAIGVYEGLVLVQDDEGIDVAW